MATEAQIAKSRKKAKFTTRTVNSKTSIIASVITSQQKRVVIVHIKLI